MVDRRDEDAIMVIPAWPLASVDGIHRQNRWFDGFTAGSGSPDGLLALRGMIFPMVAPISAIVSVMSGVLACHHCFPHT